MVNGHFLSNLQTNCYVKLDFQKVDQHTGGTWLIHGTKHYKDNQLQSLELPVKYPSWEYKFDIWFKEMHWKMLEKIFSAAMC